MQNIKDNTKNISLALIENLVKLELIKITSIVIFLRLGCEDKLKKSRMKS